jgi:triosephosphate isomerase
MNGLNAALAEADRLVVLVAGGPAPRGQIAICPPSTLLAAMSARFAGTGIFTGGQDCHQAPDGAHTGDISAPMLADAGARFVIVGHSERRIDHGEVSGLVKAKALMAFSNGLVPIICVGETRSEREAGEAEGIVSRQLDGSVPDSALREDFVIAYEPVWAIGTGLVPTLADIADMHRTIRHLLDNRFGSHGASRRILYGGSMKPGNARDILAVDNVNGGLIGGASLLSSDFYGIISAL